jgi:hypothetical protein
MRMIALLLALWLPLQGFAATLLHDHAHESAVGEPVHLLDAGEPCGKAGDAPDEDCGICAVAHAFCHLALNPGIFGGMMMPIPLGQHCLHAAPLLEPASASIRTPLRPPLARA